MPGISGLGSSCSGNLCRLTLLSWSIAPRLIMRTGTLAIWPNLRGVAPLFRAGMAGLGERQGWQGSGLKQGAQSSSSPSPAPPAQKETGKISMVNRAWGFNLVCVSSAVLISWCDMLFVGSSGISRGTQFRVAVLYFVCGWERTPTSLMSELEKVQCQSKNKTKWIWIINNYYILLTRQTPFLSYNWKFSLKSEIL